jgi:hypothetical protein
MNPIKKGTTNQALGPLALLLADRKIGAASKLAFLQLWAFAEEQVGEIVVTADWLAGACGRSPKAAWLWLDELQKHDLIAIGERNERRGSVAIKIFNPAPGNREATPDSQVLLEFTPSEVSEPKPPRPLVPKKESYLNHQSTKEFKAPRNSMDPMGVGVAVASLVDAFDPPAAAKEKLKRQIIGACCGVSGWVAGAAANLVIYHGVPLEEIDGVLCDVAEMKRAGGLKNAGAFAHSKFRKIAARYGVHWPRSGSAGPVNDGLGNEPGETFPGK